MRTQIPALGLTFALALAAAAQAASSQSSATTPDATMTTTSNAATVPFTTTSPRGAAATTTGTTSSSGSTGSSNATTDTSGAANATTATPANTLQPSNQTSGSVTSGQVTSGAERTTGVRPFDTTSGEIAGTTSPIPGIVAGTTEVISANGDRLAVNNAGPTLPAAPVANTPTPLLDSMTPSAAARLRAKAARKQQLMYSVAPRTNVDRTNEMPDDPGPLMQPSR